MIMSFCLEGKIARTRIRATSFSSGLTLRLRNRHGQTLSVRASDRVGGMSGQRCTGTKRATDPLPGGEAAAPVTTAVMLVAVLEITPIRSHHDVHAVHATTHGVLFHDDI